MKEPSTSTTKKHTFAVKGKTQKPKKLWLSQVLNDRQESEVPESSQNNDENDWEDMPETPEEVRSQQTTRKKSTNGNLSCVYCHKKYSSRSSVSHHLRKDEVCKALHLRKKLKPTKEDQERNMKYPYICKQCEKGMKSKHAWYKHNQRYHRK